MKKTTLSLLIAGAATLGGCEQMSTPADNAPAVKKEDAVASVNGKFISKASLTELEAEITQRTGQEFPKAKLIDELVQRELLVQDAKQKQLDKTPELLEKLESLKNSLLSQADIQNFLKTNPITDAEIKAEYDSKVGGENKNEFKARHILVKTEDEAKKIIAELGKGAKFEELADKHSIDNATKGGDLGWFAPNQMVQPFSEAVAALENGKYSQAPVQTPFGWHVILREDSRQATPPPLEAVKEQISPYLQRKKIQTMLEGLRSQAKVEILVPVTEEPPAKPEAAEGGQEAAPANAEGAMDAMEKAVENAGEAAKETAGQAAESMEKGASEAKEAVEGAMEKTGDTAKAMAEGAEKAAEKTGDAAKDMAGKVEQGAKDMAKEVMPENKDKK